MEVEIGIEVLAMEAFQLRRPLARNMRIAQMLANNAAVLGLGQGIVIGVPRAGLGQLNVQLLEQSGDPAVDVFRAIVGMETLDDKGERREDFLQYRDQEAFTDAFDREYALELGDLVDCVDVVDPLDTVQIALVDRVNAQKAWLALGVGPTSFTDLDAYRARLVEVAALARVTVGVVFTEWRRLYK